MKFLLNYQQWECYDDDHDDDVDDDEDDEHQGIQKDDVSRVEAGVSYVDDVINK